MEPVLFLIQGLSLIRQISVSCCYNGSLIFSGVMKKARQAELMLIFITLIWGGTFVSIKAALSYTSPLLLMGLRFFSAFLFFILINRINPISIKRKTLRNGAILGVLMFIGYGLQTIGLNYTSASRSGFITYFYALLTPFFQFFILKKKPTRGNLIGLSLAFVGLYLITGGMGRGELNLGDIITLFSAVGYSLYIVCLNLLSCDDSASLTTVQLLVTSILAFTLMPFFEDPFIHSSFVLWGNILFLSLLGSVVAVYVMTRYQSSVSPTRAAILYAMEPVFSAILAVFILGELFNSTQVFGAALILVGVLLSEVLEIRRSTGEPILNPVD